MTDFWPSCAYPLLTVEPDGRLRATPAWLRRFLDRPELALVAESCQAEQRLHKRLSDDPMAVVTDADLAALADPDVADNWRAFLAFRKAITQSDSLQAAYRGLFSADGTPVALAPLFVDALAQALVRHLLNEAQDAIEARAGEMLFRAQRVNTADGQVLAGDRDTLDLYNETGGFGEIGRLLAQAQAPLRTVELQVLGRDNAVDYWHSPHEHRFLLDLRHTVQQPVGEHGLTFTLARSASGLAGLARVLERWVAHLLGVTVRIEPLSRVDDAAWRWHVGLDTQATALLNDLYRGQGVDEARMGRLISLFRLNFDNPADALPEMAGKPVYLGLAMGEDGVFKLKPQNLLTGLPLARRS